MGAWYAISHFNYRKTDLVKTAGTIHHGQMMPFCPLSVREGPGQDIPDDKGGAGTHQIPLLHRFHGA